MKIYTENSIYEFNEEEKLVRRLPFNNKNPLRKDEEWSKYLSLRYEVGESMRLVTEHLGGDEAQVTLRTTSTVIKIEN